MVLEVVLCLWAFRLALHVTIEVLGVGLLWVVLSRTDDWYLLIGVKISSAWGST